MVLIFNKLIKNWKNLFNKKINQKREELKKKKGIPQKLIKILFQINNPDKRI